MSAAIEMESANFAKVEIICRWVTGKFFETMRTLQRLYAVGLLEGSWK